MATKKLFESCASVTLVLSMCFSGASGEIAELSRDVKAVAGGTNEFAVSLYQHLKEDRGKNLFVSPYDIAAGLSMVTAGAAGQTKEQMAEILHFSLPEAKLHSAAATLRQSLLQGANDAVSFDLRIANRLWGRKGIHFVPEFLRICQSDYNAEFGPLDFSGQTEAARETINSWIEMQTNNKIRSMVPAGMLSHETRLLLTSAVYFKARWKDVFEASATARALFHTSTTVDSDIPLMHQMLEAKYADLGEFQVIVLPYASKNASTMVILLPRKVGGLAEMERQITVANLEKWTERLAKTSVNLYLPRFKISATLDLREVLIAMGMKLIFDPSRADLTRMCSNESVCLSEVIHQAFVEVNEEGTEASAATLVSADSLSLSPEKPIEFRADHPFVFLIRDNQTKTILFMGRLVNPAPQ